MRRLAQPMLIVAAVLVAVSGLIHLREWLTIYRHLPSEIPGSYVVKIGFPVNVAVSALAVIALAFVAWKSTAGRLRVIAAVGMVELSSLATLIISKNGGLFGWNEPGWAGASMQTLVVESAALVALAAAALAHHSGVFETRPAPTPVAVSS